MSKLSSRSPVRSASSRNETRPLSYSAFFALCCFLLSLTGCSKPRLTVEDEARGSLALHAAMESYGTVTDAEVQGYLYYVATRLITGLERVGKSCRDCDLTLLNTGKALAYSPGPGHIVLSRGIITRLANEAELAFVIGHEMAHQVLDHHAAALAAGTEASGSVRESLEIEADEFAVGLLAVSGYDPRFAPSALLHAYGKVTPDGNSVGYPELYTRQTLIEDIIEQSGWRPPGTAERREFDKVKRMLIQR